MTEIEALKANLRDDAHMTQRDGLAAMLATAKGAADAIERLEAENAKLRTIVADYVDPFDVASEDEAFVVAVQIAAFQEYKR